MEVSTRHRAVTATAAAPSATGLLIKGSAITISSQRPEQEILTRDINPGVANRYTQPDLTRDRYPTAALKLAIL